MPQRTFVVALYLLPMDSLDAAVKSLGEMNKGLQAIAAEVTDYSKKTVEDSMRAFEHSR